MSEPITASQFTPKSWWRLIGWLLIALLFMAIAWRVQRAVRATLIPTAQDSSAAGPVRGQTTLRHAKRFSVEDRSDSKLVRIIDPTDDANVAQVQLVPRGRKAIAVDSKTLVIEVPVRRVIALSTAFVATFTQLGATEQLVGMADVQLLNSPELIERARRGQLVEVGDGAAGMAQNLDLERIRSLAPDLIVATYLGSAGNKLREAGLNVVESSEWLEATPLGRAEWIKFMAAFLDLEVEAERQFSDLERRYNAVAARARHVTVRPSVLCGMDYRGTWYVPGGDSYLAQLIDDAGGDYLWRSEKGTASLPLKMEAVLARAAHAEIWLLHMSAVGSKKEINETDPRYALFDAFGTGRIFNSDARLSAGGGNDFWENGVANPDLILEDLIAIIHPELSNGHALRWYRKLPEGAAR